MTVEICRFFVLLLYVVVVLFLLRIENVASNPAVGILLGGPLFLGVGL